MERDLTRLKRDNAQDRIDCDGWMRQASPDDIAKVWAACQKEYADPVMELVSRFAALALGEAMVRRMQTAGK